MADIQRRAIGAILLLVGMLTWGAADNLWLNLLASACLAAGAWVITRAVFAIVFTVLCLSLVHFWLSGISTYLFIALAAFALSAIILIRRFRQRTANTHEARWKHRQ